MLTDALNGLTRLPTPLLLAVAGFLAFSETGIGFGFVVPGETGVLVAATTVSTAPMFVAMLVVVRSPWDRTGSCCATTAYGR